MDARVNTTEKNRVHSVPAAVPWKPIALPVEHGGWSFLLEPVILGLALAPSSAGSCLAVAALAAFLTRHPLRLVFMDYRKGAHYPRTTHAWRFVFAYAAIAAVALSAALALTPSSFSFALLAAAPLAVIALALDLFGRGREAVAEITGSVALGASATAIVLAGNGAAEVAWMSWLLQSLRAVTAILYVRARLRHERSGDASSTLTIAAHVLALVGVMGLAAYGRAPGLAAVAFLGLLLRAVLGLKRPAQGIRPQVIGVEEVVWGLATLGLLVFGFRFSL